MVRVIPPPAGESPPRALRCKRGPFERDKTFGTVAVSEPIRRALDDMGYENPTPIQVEAIPVMFEGRDVVGRAPDGHRQDNRVRHPDD